MPIVKESGPKKFSRKRDFDARFRLAIHKQKTTQFHSKSMNPVAICGCPGSGTSLITKMLRHAGLFTGSDSGPFNARKYHESQCFKKYNQLFLTTTINIDYAPKSVLQFQSHNELMKEKIDELVDLVDLEKLLESYWGEFRIEDQPWGWKDPRNSATLMIWEKLFPQLKILLISRQWKWKDLWKSGGTESGNWFRKNSNRKVRQMYLEPVCVGNSSTFIVDVFKLPMMLSVFEVCSNGVDLMKLRLTSSMSFYAKLNLKEVESFKSRFQV